MMERVRWRRRAIPVNVHPLTRRMFEEMNAQQCSDGMMAERAGLSKDTLSDWRRRTTPNIAMLDACYNVLGRKLVDVDIDWQPPLPKSFKRNTLTG
jgi:hypothetical protein